MGEFSYTHTDEFGYGGYQEEARSLVPDGVPMLGAILLEMGVLDQGRLNSALERQLETGDSLAQVLMELDYAAPDQLLNALQTRANYR
ncbi:MAG: hypothetical protein VKN33_04875 [Candidatus Sericytochromatia bacterium]|nr:hypothetical protein [Candidatus Sericytochromatia bacterium]